MGPLGCFGLSVSGNYRASGSGRLEDLTTLLLGGLSSHTANFDFFLLLLHLLLLRLLSGGGREVIRFSYLLPLFTWLFVVLLPCQVCTQVWPNAYH